MHAILLNVNVGKVSQASVCLPPFCPFTGHESEFGRDGNAREEMDIPAVKVFFKQQLFCASNEGRFIFCFL